MEISRQTLSDWVAAVADLYTPIRDALKAQILKGPRIFTDDTQVRVLNPERREKKPPGEKRKQKKGAQKGTLWVYVGDESTVFDYCNPAREMDRSGSWKGIADTCRPTDFPDTGRFTAGEASPRLRAWR